MAAWGTWRASATHASGYANQFSGAGERCRWTLLWPQAGRHGIAYATRQNKTLSDTLPIFEQGQSVLSPRQIDHFGRRSVRFDRLNPIVPRLLRLIHLAAADDLVIGSLQHEQEFPTGR